MEDLYTDKEYIKSTLLVVKDVIDDLQELSAYNNDVINEETTEMQILLQKINNKLT